MKKYISLQYKFLLYFLLLSIIPIAFTGIFSAYYSSDQILENSKAAHRQKLDSVCSNIDAVMSHVNEVSHLMLQNSSLRSYMTSEISMDDSSILSFLSPFVGYNSDISSIYIERLNQDALQLGTSSAEQPMDPSVFQQIKNLDGYYLWYPDSTKTTNTLSFSRVYKNIYDSSKIWGYITIDVPISVIENTYRKQLTYPDSIFLIIDGSGNIVHSNKHEFLTVSSDSVDAVNSYSSLVNKKVLDEGYILTQGRLHSVDWTIVDLTPVDGLLAGNKLLSHVIFPVVSCTILICIGLAFYFSRKHLAPLRTLCILLKDAGRQQFKQYTQPAANDEVGVLTAEFNNMSQQLDTLIHQVYASELKQKEAEFNALQQQINPHFLYNTLDTIYWICRLEKAPEAAELTRALGDMFRLSLSKGKGMISLEDELKHLNSYLMIQEKRHKTSVTVILDVDPSPELQKAQVLKLVLQPLVENAFVHGVNNLNTENVIKIQITLEDNTVCYYITDNGCGISDDLLSQINSPDNTVGFGLRNVNERIQLLFGARYGVRVSSQLNVGTTITVTQPYRTKPYHMEEYSDDKTDGC